MLSEVIHSEHSYSAVPLAGQQTDQRFVHFGPLVAYIPLSLGAQTISSPRIAAFSSALCGGCWRITYMSLYPILI
jgi:hypothetical protein